MWQRFFGNSGPEEGGTNALTASINELFQSRPEDFLVSSGLDVCDGESGAQEHPKTCRQLPGATGRERSRQASGGNHLQHDMERGEGQPGFMAHTKQSRRAASAAPASPRDWQTTLRPSAKSSRTISGSGSSAGLSNRRSCGGPSRKDFPKGLASEITGSAGQAHPGAAGGEKTLAGTSSASVRESMKSRGASTGATVSSASTSAVERTRTTTTSPPVTLRNCPSGQTMPRAPPVLACSPGGGYVGASRSSRKNVYGITAGAGESPPSLAECGAAVFGLDRFEGLDASSGRGRVFHTVTEYSAGGSGTLFENSSASSASASSMRGRRGAPRSACLSACVSAQDGMGANSPLRRRGVSPSCVAPVESPDILGPTKRIGPPPPPCSAEAQNRQLLGFSSAATDHSWPTSYGQRGAVGSGDEVMPSTAGGFFGQPLVDSARERGRSLQESRVFGGQMIGLMMPRISLGTRIGSRSSTPRCASGLNNIFNPTSANGDAGRSLHLFPTPRSAASSVSPRKRGIEAISRIGFRTCSLSSARHYGVPEDIRKQQEAIDAQTATANRDYSEQEQRVVLTPSLGGKRREPGVLEDDGPSRVDSLACSRQVSFDAVVLGSAEASSKSTCREEDSSSHGAKETSRSRSLTPLLQDSAADNSCTSSGAPALKKRRHKDKARAFRAEVNETRPHQEAIKDDTHAMDTRLRSLFRGDAQASETSLKATESVRLTSTASWAPASRAGSSAPASRTVSSAHAARAVLCDIEDTSRAESSGSTTVPQLINLAATAPTFSGKEDLQPENKGACVANKDVGSAVKVASTTTVERGGPHGRKRLHHHNLIPPDAEVKPSSLADDASNCATKSVSECAEAPSLTRSSRNGAATTTRSRSPTPPAYKALPEKRARPFIPGISNRKVTYHHGCAIGASSSEGSQSISVDVLSRLQQFQQQNRTDINVHVNTVGSASSRDNAARALLSEKNLQYPVIKISSDFLSPKEPAADADQAAAGGVTRHSPRAQRLGPPGVITRIANGRICAATESENEPAVYPPNSDRKGYARELKLQSLQSRRAEKKRRQGLEEQGGSSSSTSVAARPRDPPSCWEGSASATADRTRENHRRTEAATQGGGSRRHDEESVISKHSGCSGTTRTGAEETGKASKVSILLPQNFKVEDGKSAGFLHRIVAKTGEGISGDATKYRFSRGMLVPPNVNAHVAGTGNSQPISSPYRARLSTGRKILLSPEKDGVDILSLDSASSCSPSTSLKDNTTIRQQGHAGTQGNGFGGPSSRGDVSRSTSKDVTTRDFVELASKQTSPTEVVAPPSSSSLMFYPSRFSDEESDNNFIVMTSVVGAAELHSMHPERKNYSTTPALHHQKQIVGTSVETARGVGSSMRATGGTDQNTITVAYEPTRSSGECEGVEHRQVIDPVIRTPLEDDRHAVETEVVYAPLHQGERAIVSSVENSSLPKTAAGLSGLLSREREGSTPAERRGESMHLLPSAGSRGSTPVAFQSVEVLPQEGDRFFPEGSTGSHPERQNKIISNMRASFEASKEPSTSECVVFRPSDNSAGSSSEHEHHISMKPGTDGSFEEQAAAKDRKQDGFAHLLREFDREKILVVLNEKLVSHGPAKSSPVYPEDSSVAGMFNSLLPSHVNSASQNHANHGAIFVPPGHVEPVVDVLQQELDEKTSEQGIAEVVAGQHPHMQIASSPAENEDSASVDSLVPITSGVGLWNRGSHLMTRRVVEPSSHLLVRAAEKLVPVPRPETPDHAAEIVVPPVPPAETRDHSPSCTSQFSGKQVVPASAALRTFRGLSRDRQRRKMPTDTGLDTLRRDASRSRADAVAGRAFSKSEENSTSTSGWGKPENPFANLDPNAVSVAVSPSDGSVVVDGSSGGNVGFVLRGSSPGEAPEFALDEIQKNAEVEEDPFLVSFSAAEKSTAVLWPEVQLGVEEAVQPDCGSLQEDELESAPQDMSVEKRSDHDASKPNIKMKIEQQQQNENSSREGSRSPRFGKSTPDEHSDAADSSKDFIGLPRAFVSDEIQLESRPRTPEAMLRGVREAESRQLPENTAMYREVGGERTALMMLDHSVSSGSEQRKVVSLEEIEAMYLSRRQGVDTKIDTGVSPGPGESLRSLSGAPPPPVLHINHPDRSLPHGEPTTRTGHQDRPQRAVIGDSPAASLLSSSSNQEFSIAGSYDDGAGGGSSMGDAGVDSYVATLNEPESLQDAFARKFADRFAKNKARAEARAQRIALRREQQGGKLEGRIRDKHDHSTRLRGPAGGGSSNHLQRQSALTRATSRRHPLGNLSSTSSTPSEDHKNAATEYLLHVPSGGRESKARPRSMSANLYGSKSKPKLYSERQHQQAQEGTTVLKAGGQRTRKEQHRHCSSKQLDSIGSVDSIDFGGGVLSIPFPKRNGRASSSPTAASRRQQQMQIAKMNGAATNVQVDQRTSGRKITSTEQPPGASTVRNHAKTPAERVSSRTATPASLTSGKNLGSGHDTQKDRDGDDARATASPTLSAYKRGRDYGEAVRKAQKARSESRSASPPPRRDLIPPKLPRDDALTTGVPSTNTTYVDTPQLQLQAGNRYNFFEGLVSASPSDGEDMIEEERHGGGSAAVSRQNPKSSRVSCAGPNKNKATNSTTPPTGVRAQAEDHVGGVNEQNCQEAASTGAWVEQQSRRTGGTGDAGGRLDFSPGRRFARRSEGIVDETPVESAAPDFGARKLTTTSNSNRKAEGLDKVAEEELEQQVPGVVSSSGRRAIAKQEDAKAHDSSATESVSEECLMCNQRGEEMGEHFCKPCERKMYADIKNNFVAEMTDLFQKGKLNSTSLAPSSTRAL
ncbi:unnamed protein product [Amoebophrya sp. A25]|nr:unnamed protein product [Amoebophrya sp. A25]|eukprot:GSA25T00000051001.1